MIIVNLIGYLDIDYYNVLVLDLRVFYIIK